MRRRPIATVRILKVPQFARDAVQVEIECRFSTAGLTSVAAERIGLTVLMLVTSAVYAHEECCGACDMAQAHERGDQAIRAATDEAWEDVQAELGRCYVAERRN
jgi:hypothetical protein